MLMRTSPMSTEVEQFLTEIPRSRSTLRLSVRAVPLSTLPASRIAPL